MGCGIAGVLRRGEADVEFEGLVVAWGNLLNQDRVVVGGGAQPGEGGGAVEPSGIRALEGDAADEVTEASDGPGVSGGVLVGE